MGEHRSLADACRAVGLGCCCEHLSTEPRFRVAIDQSRSRPLLYLVLRNDDSIVPRPLQADPDLPGILFEVVEKTVCREPVKDVWLPHSARHRHVAWRDNGVWRVGRLGDLQGAATVAELVGRLQDS